MRLQLTVLLAALVSFGCAVHVGPDGVDVVLAGTYYAHSDDQTDTGNGEGAEGAGSSRWRTHAARTWGTSGIEGEITTDKELISIQGSGMSDNLSETLGDDIVEKVADQVSCALQPAQPKCINP